MSLTQLLKSSPRELQAELQLILNAVVEGLCGVDKNGSVTFCNEALLTMTGYRREELIGRSIHEAVHNKREDGSPYPKEECPMGRAVAAGEEVHNAAELLWRKDGSSFPAEYWVHPMQRPAGATMSVITVQDMTERERSVDALRSSEERFRQISENIDQAFYLVDTTGLLSYISPAFERITGLPCQEARAKQWPWPDLVSPEHRERMLEDSRRLMQGEEVKSEYKIQHRDGSARWILRHARPICCSDGHFSGIAGVVEDVTEIHEAREKLRRSEEKFRRILLSVADVAWTSDRNGQTLYISPRVEEVLGYSKEEISAAGSKLRLGLIHPHDFGRVKKGYLALFNEGRRFDEEYRIRRKDGSWIWIHDHATGTHEENGTLYADGVFSDISARKRAEEELRWKTAFLEAQTDSTMDAMVLIDPHGYPIFANDKFVKLFPETAEIIAEHHEHGMLKHVLSRAKDGESFRTLAERLNRQPDEVGYCELELEHGMILEVYSAPVLNKEEKKYYGRIWTARDITAKKRDEQKLRHSEAYLAESQRLSHIGSWAWKSQGDFVYWSEEHYRIFGMEPGDGRVPFENSQDRIHPEDIEEFRRVVRESIKEKKDYETDIRIVQPDGTIRDIHSSGHPVFSENGEFVEMLGLSQDVTERKRNADTLLQLSMAVEQSPATVLITDPELKISYVNRRFTEITGYEAQEMLGKTSGVLKSGKAASETCRDLWSALNAGREWRGEFCSKKKNGELFWEAATIRPIVDGAGKLTHYLVLSEDVTERRQTEREHRLTQFSLEHASDTVFWVNPKGRIVYANRSACRSLGYTREELVALSIPDIDPNFSWETWDTFWPDLKSRGSMTLEATEKSKLGRIFPVEVRANYLEFDGQEYCFAFVRDISERRSAEEELRSSRRMLQSILDAIPQRVFWKDRNCTYEGCNRPFAMDAGLSAPEAIVGKTDRELAWKEVADAYRADDEKVMESGQAKLGYQEIQTRTDGSLLWLQTNKLPLFDRDGEVTGVVGTYEDVTARKQAERELRLTKSSLDITSDTVLWIDPQARIVYANEGASRTLGYSSPDLVSLLIPDIDPLYPIETWNSFWEELRLRRCKTFETQHKSKTGRIFPVEVTANFLEFDGQEYLFAFARDITERRELESQLRQAQKLEGIGQLASGIAHEINTPTQFVADNLTFLRDSWKSANDLLQAYRAALRNGALPAEMASELERVEKACDLDFVVTEVPHAIEQSLDGAHRVAEIVRAMKEFSHPDSLEKTATDLNKGISSTITVARNEWKYVAGVETRLDDTLPRVVCYPGDVNQVILNLLVNAAHAIKEKMKDGEKGKITVCSRRRGEFAEIAITDTGSGIPEHIRTRIFDPFFTTKEVGKGTGQGLSLAHAVVVKKHGGKIWFDTEMGRGTTFYIQLPIEPADRPKENQ